MKNKYGFEVSKEPLLAKAMDEFIDKDEYEDLLVPSNFFCDWTLLYSQHRYLDKLPFTMTLAMDNFYPVTLKPCKELWNKEALTIMVARIASYCLDRKIEYYLMKEVGSSNNTHYHGMLGFPSEKVRKNFQTWFNKNFGLIKTSEKPQSFDDNFIDMCQLGRWYDYIHKASKDKELSGTDIDYIFDN